jgi:hypothetical protein
MAVVTLSGPVLAKDEPALAPYQLGGRLGAGGGSNALYILLQIDGGYRVFPALLLGASFEKTLVSAEMSSDSCVMGRQCPANYLAFGPRAELQPAPEWVIGPWLGAKVGAILLDGRAMKPAAVEGTLDLGIDVRPSTSWAIGPYVATKLFLTDPYSPVPYETHSSRLGVVSIGLRGSGRF